MPSPRGEEVLERTPSLREGTPERMLELRGVSLRLEFLKLLLRSDELRLELLNELLRLEELLELLRLELLLNELWPPPLLRLLLIDELLWLPPPPRLPPPRCASAGVALSARPIITKVIHFEVFISLLLSFFVYFCIRFLMQKYNLSPSKIPQSSHNFPHGLQCIKNKHNKTEKKLVALDLLNSMRPMKRYSYLWFWIVLIPLFVSCAVAIRAVYMIMALKYSLSTF